jgi:hypothetical protein
VRRPEVTERIEILGSRRKEMKPSTLIFTLVLFAVSLAVPYTHAAEAPPMRDASRHADTPDTSHERKFSPDKIESKLGFFERLFTRIAIVKNPFVGISVITIADPPSEPLGVQTPPGRNMPSTGPDLDEDPWDDIK